MFVVLNIIERRKICLGAKLPTQKSTLPHVASLLKDLNYEEVKRRLDGESQSPSHRRNFIQDRVLSRLMQVTSVANGLARGSRQYMRNRRNEIRGLFLRFGAPKFFITINPDDVRHPLALVMGLEKDNGE